MRHTRFRMDRRALGALALLLSSTAVAAPHVMQLAPGIGGPRERDGGPGNEQPALLYLSKGGSSYIVTIYMSSNVPQEDRPWQLKCSSIKLNATGAPTIMADQVQLTHYNGNRPANHPAVATDGSSVVFLFGSNHDNEARVQTYAGLTDETCQLLNDPMQNRVSNNRANNEGAADIQFNGNGLFTGGYLSQGGDVDRSIAIGLQLSGTTLTVTYRHTVVAPANIGRPAIVVLAQDRSLFCAAKGDERPPEVGVECGLIDTTAGTVLWRNVVAPSQPSNWPGVNAGLYMNQPSVGKLDETHVAVSVVSSTGEGRNKNHKGSSMAHLYLLTPTDAGPGAMTQADQLGAYQVHNGLCTGAYGANGDRAVAIFDTSITGSGVPALTFAKLNAGAQLAMGMMDQRVVGAENGDSGYLSNRYGRNPNYQGRDFLRCIGDVPNPGYHVTGGFMPNVRTFFVAPYDGRKMGDPKNALFMSFVPGQVDAPLPPDPGHPGDNNNSSNPGNPNDPNNPNPPGKGPPSLWGCSVGLGGVGAEASSLAVLGLLGFALILSSRRQRS